MVSKMKEKNKNARSSRRGSVGGHFLAVATIGTVPVASARDFCVDGLVLEESLETFLDY